MIQEPTRVLYLSHAFHVGGAEEMVLNLVRTLPPRFEPHVCCIHSAGAIGEEIRRTGVPFSVLGLTPGIKRPFDVLRIRGHLVRTRPTVVHTFLLTASVYGRMAAILARVPIVIGTEVNIYERKRRHHIAAERMLMAGTDHVIVSAESVRDFYIDQVHADARRVSVIYNAVDWSQLNATATRAQLLASIGVPADAPIITIIARLTEQKAHRVLFDAMAATPGLRQARLLVVGGGELADELQQRAVQQGIAARVHFLGARRDLGNLLGATDVFVMPSLWEGLPLSMVLAMGAGLPVVATRVAGIPEVVRHDETGLLVEPGQSESLGQALAALVDDAALRRRLGDAARDYVRPRFGADKYVTAVTDLYDRLLASEGMQ